MLKPISLKHTRVAVLGIALAGTSALLPQAAQAQGGIRFPGQIAQIQRITPRLTPELRTFLIAKKPVVSSEVLRSAFILQDGIPAFKLDDGTTRLLMPSSDAPAQTTATAPLPPELSPAQSYIFSPQKLESVRNSVIKFNPSFILLAGVDHRSNMTPIRDQGPRGTCTAFAFCGAVESFPNVQTDLSEQYLFHEGQRKAGQPYSTHKGLLPTIAAEVGTEGLVRENLFPYTNSYPPNNETIPQAAVDSKKFKVQDWHFIPNSGLTGVSVRNTNYLETLLNQGYNIPFWTQVAWYGSHTNDVIDVVIDSVTHQPAASGGDHEMVIVGYDASQKYFIVRNSWGTGFGHAGYAYMSYDYIRTYAVEGLYITKVSAPPRIFNPNLGTMIKPGIRINPRIVR